MEKRTCLVEGCVKLGRSRGWCPMHYMRWWKTGTVERHVPTVEERFWGRVAVLNEGCWLWTGQRRHSYGSMYVNRRTIYAHRLGYEIQNGPIPDGLFVCHHCDTPMCVRGDHLFVGTQADNMADCAAKGRANHDNRRHGESNPSAKLTAAEVAQMRSLRSEGWNQPDLVKRFGVSQSQVSRILAGECWARPEWWALCGDEEGVA